MFLLGGYVLRGFVLRGGEFSPTTDEEGVSDLGKFDRGGLVRKPIKAELKRVV